MAPLTRLTTQLMLSYATTKLGFEKQCHDTPKSVGPELNYGGPSISATSWGFNRMDVFGITGNSVAHQYWDGYQWGPSYDKIEVLGGEFDSPPKAISPGKEKMDIFQVSNINGSLMHKFWDGSAWRPAATAFESLGGNLDPFTAPAATVNGSNPIDVFGRSADGDSILHKYWDGSAWQPEGDKMEDLSDGTTKLVYGPTAVSWGPNRTDIFALDTERKPKHQYWDGTSWLSKWESLGDATLTYSPTAISWGVNRLDLFGIDWDSGSLLHYYWDGSQWSMWEDLGKPSADVALARFSTVAATSWSTNRTDIVALGEDGAYYYKYWDGSQWQPSVDGFIWKGGNFRSSPEVVSWGENRLDIYGVHRNRNLQHMTWYGSGWYPAPDYFETLGGPLRTWE